MNLLPSDLFDPTEGRSSTMGLGQVTRRCPCFEGYPGREESHMGHEGVVPMPSDVQVAKERPQRRLGGANRMLRRTLLGAGVPGGLEPLCGARRWLASKARSKQVAQRLQELKEPSKGGKKDREGVMEIPGTGGLTVKKDHAELMKIIMRKPEKEKPKFSAEEIARRDLIAKKYVKMCALRDKRLQHELTRREYLRVFATKMLPTKELREAAETNPEFEPPDHRRLWTWTPPREI